MPTSSIPGPAKGTSYFRKVWRGVSTTAKGLALTWKHFVTKPTTIQYPEEKPYFSPFERGIHEFEPEVCIICNLCAVACPVNCILIESTGAGKTAVLTKYEIDYSKCLFCALCVDPCPVDCIHMGQEYDLTGFERGDVTKIDFTKGEGDWRTVRTSAHPAAGLRAHGEQPLAANTAPHEPPMGDHGRHGHHGSHGHHGDHAHPVGPGTHGDDKGTTS